MLRSLIVSLTVGFAPIHSAKAGDLTLSTEIAMTEAAATAGFGVHVGVHPSGFGLATSLRAGTSYDGSFASAASGELRYTLDVFTYVPWIALGLGLRVEDQPLIFPEASLGCSMMLGFDDSVGLRYKTPLNFQGFSSSFPFEIGLFWSRNL